MTANALTALTDRTADSDSFHAFIRYTLIASQIDQNRPYYEPSLILPELTEQLDEHNSDFEDETPIDAETGQSIFDLLNLLNREEITELALSLSLCPIHLIDYAICFDDENAECAQVRLIHPSHDT